MRDQSVHATKGMPRRRDTSWAELTTQESMGTVYGSFAVGDEDDVSAPRVFRGVFPPGCRLEPHSHACDYAEIILEGSQKVGRRWYRQGDVRIVRARTVYGPLIAGPQGATVMVVFRNADYRARPAGRSDVWGDHREPVAADREATVD
jgi:hypothetical protein